MRGKSGRVYGHLLALLTLMKAQPLAYNKDNQEDKEPVFDSLDTVLACLRAFADMVPALRVQRDAMARAARRGFSTATDLADYLVRKGLPFRDAHEVVGKAVRAGLDSGRDLAQMPLAELRGFSPLIGEDVFPGSGRGGFGARPRPCRRHRAGTGARRHPARALASEAGGGLAPRRLG